jgi:hypothetical protein
MRGQPRTVSEQALELPDGFEHLLTYQCDDDTASLCARDEASGEPVLLRVAFRAGSEADRALLLDSPHRLTYPSHFPMKDRWLGDYAKGSRGVLHAHLVWTSAPLDLLDLGPPQPPLGGSGLLDQAYVSSPIWQY